MRIAPNIVLLAWCCFGTQFVFADDTKAANTVKQFAASMAAFPFYQCRYVAAQGFATVDEKTHVIKWKSKATADCRYAVDGDFEAFEQFGNARPDLSKKPAANEKNGIAFIKEEGFTNDKMIRGSSGHGDWMDVFGNLTLTTRARISEEKPVFAPLDFGFAHRRPGGPEVIFTQPKRFVVTDLGAKDVLGRACVGHRIEPVADPRAEADWSEVVWFDVERGMMPIWLESTNKTARGLSVNRHVVTSARLLSKGRWFPDRQILYSVGAQTFVTEYTLTDVDADTRPTKDQLSVVLPAGTAIRSDEQIPFTPTKFFKLRQDEKLSGHDIAELFEKLAKVEPGKRMDTAIRHDSGRTSIWFWVLGGGGLLLVLFGGYRWLRNRSASRSAAPDPGTP